MTTDNTEGRGRVAAVIGGANGKLKGGRHLA